MSKPTTLNSSELIEFISEKIAQSADWREGFGNLLEFLSTRLATGDGFIRLYHYIANRYLEPVCVHSEKGNSLTDSVFEQMAEDHAPVAYPVEYSGYLADEMMYSVVGIPFVKNGELLGGLVLAGGDGEGVSERNFQDLLAFAPFLLPIFESAVLQEILLTNYLDAIETLAVALEAKDSYTRGHSNMVTAYATAIARKMELDARTVQSIEIGAMMHDIGKIGVPDQILRKPANLTKEEFEIVKRHPVIGEEILKPMQHPLFKVPRQVVRWHHERIDGTGYPDGLKGDEIPLEAKITFVADAYDAMTSERPYRQALPPEKAFEELRRNAGTQFEPEIVEILCNLLGPMAGKEETEAEDEAITDE